VEVAHGEDDVGTLLRRREVRCHHTPYRRVLAGIADHEDAGARGERGSSEKHEHSAA